MDKRAFLKAFLRGVKYHIAKLRIYDANGGKISAQIREEVAMAATQRGISPKVECKQKVQKTNGVVMLEENETNGENDVFMFLCGSNDDYKACLAFIEQQKQEEKGAHL